MADAKKRVLVLGGTVYLSKEVARQALARGHDVTVACRGASGEPPEGANFIRIDRSSAEGVEPLRGLAFDAVIDVARLPAQVGRALDVLADGVGHWTFVSSISVYADHSRTDSPLHEPSEPDSEDPDMERYGANKVACENLVRDRLGDQAFIPRPGLIVGPGDDLDRIGYWLLRIAEGGEVLAPGRPERLVQWIGVEDFASWILDAAEQQLGGTINAIADPVPMRDFLDGVAEAITDLGLAKRPTELTWVDQEFLTEHGVNPWAGPDSLGLWLPEPEYVAMTSQDAGRAAEAGLPSSPLATVVRRWWEANSEAPQLAAGISREKEGAVLGAWHDRSRTFTVPQPRTDDGPA